MEHPQLVQMELLPQAVTAEAEPRHLFLAHPQLTLVAAAEVRITVVVLGLAVPAEVALGQQIQIRQPLGPQIPAEAAVVVDEVAAIKEVVVAQAVPALSFSNTPYPYSLS